MAGPQIHKDLAPLASEAKKAGWRIESTSTGQLCWIDPEGTKVKQHTANLREDSKLLPSIKRAIRKKLDAQYLRDKALKAIESREAGERALQEIGKDPSILDRPPIVQIRHEGPAAAPPPVVFEQADLRVESPAASLLPTPSAVSVPAETKQGLTPEIRPLLRKQQEVGPRFPYEVRMVKVADLKVADIHSGGYQRPADENWAIKLAMQFSWDDFGRVEVSERDGQLWVVDGQHRILSLELTDLVPEESKIEVPAIVYSGMSLLDEADRYLRLNTVRKNTFSLHAWAARLVSDPKAQDIDRIVREAGWVIGASGSSGKGFVSAVARLEALYDDFGPETLARTLTVIRKAYGTAETVSMVLLGGVGLLLGIYDKVDEDRLVLVLGRVSAREWLARVKFYTTNPGNYVGDSGMRPSTQPVALAQMLVLAYNANNRKLEKTLGSFDNAYGQYVLAKRTSARNKYVAEKRSEFRRAKPSPGSWLQTSREG